MEAPFEVTRHHHDRGLPLFLQIVTRAFTEPLGFRRDGPYVKSEHPAGSDRRGVRFKAVTCSALGDSCDPARIQDAHRDHFIEDPSLPERFDVVILLYVKRI